MREADLQGWIVSIILDVSLRRGGEGFFILEDLQLERVQGVVERLDRRDVLFFSLFDRGDERADNIDKEDGVVVVEIPFHDGSGGPRGEWRRLIVGVVEHASGADGRVDRQSWLHLECDSG